jgi:hypothetical protein
MKVVDALSLVSVFERSVSLVGVDPVEFWRVLRDGADKTSAFGTSGIVQVKPGKRVSILEDPMVLVDGI